MTIAMKIHESFQAGLEQGIEQGIQQGEYKRALEAARRMLNYGDSVEKIADITQLSLDEIQSLQKNLSQ